MSDTEMPDRPRRKATWRLGQRELSRLSLVVILGTVALLGFGGYRVFLNFKAQRDIVIAKSNLHALYEAIHSGYAQDYESRLPPAQNWTDAVQGYLSAPPGTPGGKTSYLHGPGDGAQEVGYVYNDLASGYSLDPAATDSRQKQIDPRDLVLLIERTGAPTNAHLRIPPQDTPEGQAALYKLLEFPHFAEDPNNATTVILYANGNVAALTRQDLRPQGAADPGGK